MRIALVLAGAVLATATAALAQPTRIGTTQYVKPADGGTRRFSSVSYDAANNAYLVAWGLGNVGARYIDAAGTALGTPVNVNITTAGAARVACGASANMCLVAWLQEPTTVMGRLVRYSAGSVAFVTAPFTISTNGKSKLTSAAPAVAYSPVASEFFVAWTEFSGTAGGPDIRGQLVSTAGARVGTEIAVAATTNWEGMPSATYNSALDEYAVGYYYETSGGTDCLGIQRVKPVTGALVGTRSTLFATRTDLYPEIAYNSATNQYFAISWGAFSPWMLRGWIADGTAQPLTTTARSLAAQGGGDGIGLTYNPVSNTYFAVYLSQRNEEIWGVEIAADGTPGPQAQLTSTEARSGFATQPQAAGSTVEGKFYLAASDGYTKVMGQLAAHGSMTSPTTCTTPSPGTGYTCVNGVWVPPAPPPSSCTTVQPAPTWTCVNGNWLPPTTPPPPPPPTGCTTPSPGSGWTCVNGNWIPPANNSSCTTVRPGPTWTCVNGNWLPPTTPPPPPPTTSCTTVQPGPNWTCVNGNWLPPTTNSSCTTVQPGANWTCVNGNWLPPTTNSSCTTVQPGANWTCVNGNWLPPTTNSSCTSVQPGAGWTCVNGNWLPPTTTPPPTTSCTTVRPGPDWTCRNGNWLPPGM